MSPILELKYLTKKRLLLLILVISIIFVSAGYFYYSSEKKSIILSKHQEIKAIADLKITELSDWYIDQLHDAEFISRSKELIKLINEYEDEKKYESKENILELLNEKKIEHDYSNAMLIYPSGKVMLSTESNFSEIDSVTKYYLNLVVKKGNTYSSDIYRCKIHNELQIDFISPIKNNKDSVIAVIILRQNPENFIYPLVNYWPTPSKTSETLLIRKEGNEVIFLNNLRFVSNSALKLKIPLTKTEVPAVQAVLGKVGIFEGKDYRNIPVLSFVSSIPGTPWSMVAKVDKSEIYEELYYKTGVVIVFVLLLILLSSFGLTWVYYYNQRNIYKSLWETQEEYKTILASVGDAVITTDKKGNIKFINPVGELLTGWTTSEAKGKKLQSVFNIIDEDTRLPVENPVIKILREGIVVGLANHTLLISKEGNEIPIADSGAPIKNDKGEIIGVVLVFSDKTEERKQRKALEESEAFIRSVMDNLPIGIAVNSVIPTVEFSYINENFLKFYRIKKESLKDPDKFWDAVYEDSEFREIMKRKVLEDCQTGDATKMFWENIPITRKGEETKYINARNIPIHEKNLMISTVWDVTERVNAEKEIINLNRLYAMLSQSNQAIVRQTNRDDLFAEICRVAVQYGKFHFAFIGLYENNRIEPVTSFGSNNGISLSYLNNESADILSLLPCYQAIKENKVIILNNIQTNETIDKWGNELIKNGVRSIAAAPLVFEEKIIGVLVLYSSEINFFGKQEISLIEEITMDISFALETYKMNFNRKMMEDLLRESEETYRNIFQNAQVGLFRTRISDGKILESNERLAEMFGYNNREEFIREYTTSQNYVDAGTREKMLKEINENGSIRNFEARFYKKDKSIFWARYSAKIYPEKDWIEGVAEDITQLKIFEDSLRESEEKFRRIAENAQDLIYRYEFYPTRGFTYVSPSATQITGYTPEEHYSDPDLGFKIVHPDDRHLLQSISAGEELIKKPVTLRWIRKDEKIIWTEQKNIPIYNDNGDLIAIEGIARDVSEIKLTEIELIKSEERYRTLFENALVGIYRTTPDGRILLANMTLIKMLGYNSYQELVQRNLNDIDYKPTYKRDDFIKMLVEKNVIDSFDSIWHKKDGSSIFVRESVKVIKDAENNPIYFEGIVQDITEKKLAEAKLKESEEKYRVISEMISDYAYCFNVEEGNKLVREWVTDSFIRITGYTSQEIDERGGWVSLIHPNDMHIATNRARTLLEGFEDVSEFRIIRKDGTIRWLQDYGKPIWDASLKRVVRILGAAKDITENKKAEELLINERLLLRTVIDNLPVAIYVKNKNYMKTLANKMDVINCGATNEMEVLGKTDQSFYSKDEADRFILDDKKVIENGDSIINKEESFIYKNGNLKWLLTSKIPLKNSKGEIEGLLGIGIDITKIKEYERELIIAKEKAEESDKLKSEFLAQMSHEIRTPLHIITSSLGLVEEDLAGTIPDEDLELFDNIKISAKRIMRTINLILNVSEIQLGIYQPIFKDIDLEKIILLPLVNEHKPLAINKKIDLVYLCNTLNKVVKIDEYSVTQIFANLIDNAIKYTNEGRVEVNLLDDKAGNIIVEIKDTGIGMTEEFMKNLFKPFMQEEHGLSRSYEGNGLGLSLVKGYCELNNIDIEVKSQKNIGTVFRIIFNTFS